MLCYLILSNLKKSYVITWFHFEFVNLVKESTVRWKVNVLESSLIIYVPSLIPYFKGIKLKTYTAVCNQ